MSTRRDALAQQTRAQLLAEARTAFTDRGFARTSLDRLAQTAEVTKGAVYHHFPSKKALFREVYETLAAELDRRIAQRTDTITDPRLRVLAGIDAFLEGVDIPAMRVIMFRDGLAVLAGECRVIDERYFLDRLRRELVALRGEDPLTPMLARLVLAALIEAAQILGQAQDVERTRPQVRSALVTLLATLLVPQRA
ncbi:MAG: TetR family transcriptional regulator [Myxococcota bacterium]